ncbi:MAG: protein-tyrosine phosphatase family protein [Acidimicrobiales bacterium]
MKGKWASGIAPRNFAWIIKDGLAVSERPGGYARSHRPVRRQEEIIWIREQGFDRVVSLLPSPHNLHAYDEAGVVAVHIPFGPHDSVPEVLHDLLPRLEEWLGAGEKVLIHQEELSDRLQGIAAGYLVYTGLVVDPAQAIAIVEQLNQRQMGPIGRQVVSASSDMAETVAPPRAKSRSAGTARSRSRSGVTPRPGATPRSAARAKGHPSPGA